MFRKWWLLITVYPVFRSTLKTAIFPHLDWQEKVVLIFMFQSEVILKNPIHIILIAIPLIIQTFLIFGIAYVACYLLKLPHNIAAPAGMIGASNFFELAVAVAIALFGTTSEAALATTVGVLTEVPVMLMLVRIANKTKGRFL